MQIASNRTGIASSRSSRHLHSSRHLPRFWLHLAPVLLNTRSQFLHYSTSLLPTHRRYRREPQDTNPSGGTLLNIIFHAKRKLLIRRICKSCGVLDPFVLNLGFTHRARFLRDLSRKLANARCWTMCAMRHATDIERGCTFTVGYTLANSTPIMARGAEHLPFWKWPMQYR